MRSLSISLDGCQSLWMELTVTESKTQKKRNMNAAVTVQKSAHRILLYSLRGAEQELPLFITDQRDFSPPPRVPVRLPTGAVWTRQPFSFHRKHNLSTWSEAEVAQTTGGQTSPGVINLSPLIFLLSRGPLSRSLILPVSFLCPIIHSLVFFFFFPFFYWPA